VYTKIIPVLSSYLSFWECYKLRTCVVVAYSCCSWACIL